MKLELKISRLNILLSYISLTKELIHDKSFYGYNNYEWSPKDLMYTRIFTTPCYTLYPLHQNK